MFSGKKSIFSPFKFLANILKKPTTVRYPSEDIDIFDRPGASPNYRGLHINDMNTCIGCGTCQDICPVDAITMVPGDNIGDGKLGVRPEMDYGRCSFCALCVDICTTGSLTMSRDYLRTYPTPVNKFGPEEVKARKKFFKYLPGDEHSDNIGHIATDEISLLDFVRVDMEEHTAKERWDSFLEIIKGYSRKQALKEASRCVECGVCTETCPAKMNIPEYIHSIWENDLKSAVEWMYKTNPLSGVCGRICTHQCETVCSISYRGEAVAIRWLKRYAIDNLPTDEIIKIASETITKPVNKKVAIIGGGPAGLSAAYYLTLLGYSITIYDENNALGGMMRYGIPEYRLPYDKLDRDIDIIKSLGVTVKTKSKIDKKKFAKLRKDYDAVFVSVGFQVGLSIKIPGIDSKNCYMAMDLLRAITNKKKIFIGKKILVIGGGNVAFDIARSLTRLQRNKTGRVDVTIACLESKKEMPCDLEELIEGREEGIIVKPSRYPVEIVSDKRKGMLGLRTYKCTRVFDAEGKFSPQYDEKNVEIYSADMIVEAVGQTPDYTLFDTNAEKQLEMVRGRILTDELGETNIKGLFAGGDIVHGPDVITAVQDGHNSAKAIDEFLIGKKRKK